jgi:hypothetical protein
MTDTWSANVNGIVTEMRKRANVVRHLADAYWMIEAADMLEALAAENVALRTRAETADMRADNLSDKLELERALTDGAHRRAREAEADAAALRAALGRIVEWSDAYPTAVFPEPDFARAAAALSAAGMSLDVISASNMRHATKGCGDIARAALEPAKGREAVLQEQEGNRGSDERGKG